MNLRKTISRKEMLEIIKQRLDNGASGRDCEFAVADFLRTAERVPIFADDDFVNQFDLTLDEWRQVCHGRWTLPWKRKKGEQDAGK
jgi:hypothetical protein